MLEKSTDRPSVGASGNRLFWVTFAVIALISAVSDITLFISNNFFLEIAKIRAFRFLWKSKTGLDPYIFTSNSKLNKTEDKGFNNIISTTTECMSAIIGGANAIMSRAYNSSYEESNNFSDRIARNQHKILLNESYLDKVQDPSHGSYYIEYLTNELIKELNNVTVD